MCSPALNYISLDFVIDGVFLGPRLREEGGEIHLDIRKRERKRKIEKDRQTDR